MQYEFVSNHEVVVGASELAKKILAEQAVHGQIDIIVSINQGGAILARYLGDMLGVEVIGLGLKSYEDLEQGAGIRVTQEITRDLTQKRVLLVDEIFETGRTLREAIRMLYELGVLSVLSACLIWKPKTAEGPDYWAWQTDAWVVFSYEAQETIKALLKQHQLQENPELSKQLEAFFVAEGYDLALLERFGLPVDMNFRPEVMPEVTE